MLEATAPSPQPAVSPPAVPPMLQKTSTPDISGKVVGGALSVAIWLDNVYLGTTAGLLDALSTVATDTDDLRRLSDAELDRVVAPLGLNPVKARRFLTKIEELRGERAPEPPPTLSVPVVPVPVPVPALAAEEPPSPQRKWLRTEEDSIGKRDDERVITVPCGKCAAFLCFSVPAPRVQKGCVLEATCARPSCHAVLRIKLRPKPRGTEDANSFNGGSYKSNYVAEDDGEAV
jgi:hypothetical protein